MISRWRKEKKVARSNGKAITIFEGKLRRGE